MRSHDTEEPAAEADARRAMEICNVCRYCDGYCAVFVAMKTRRSFSAADLTFLANLCHNCRSCHYACQYAPPHAFAVNVPRSLALVRHASYREHVWPRAAGVLFRRNGLIVGGVTLTAILAVLALAFLGLPPGVLFRPHAGPGAFYDLVPWPAMAGVAGAALGWSLLALLLSVASVWRGFGARITGASLLPALVEAAWDVATLRNLGGGGPGCADQGERTSQARRCFHQSMLTGMALCFAATAVATVYDHALGWAAPYPLLSLPVLLGSAGGVGILVGTAGLALLKRNADPELTARHTLGADHALLGQLFLMAASGLALLALRETAAMGVLLMIHLGAVLGFFLTLPFGKFLHGPFRAAALLRAALERRRDRRNV